VKALKVNELKSFGLIFTKFTDLRLAFGATIRKKMALADSK